MAKIRVKTPVVEMDGDEMTRIIWQKIRETLILPYLDIDLKYFDLGIESRAATGDQSTIEAGQGNSPHGVAARQGVKPQGGVALPEELHPQHPRRHDLP